MEACGVRVRAKRAIEHLGASGCRPLPAFSEIRFQFRTIGRVRFDRNNVFPIRHQAIEEKRHRAFMRTGVQKNLALAQASRHFRNEETVVSGNRSAFEDPFLSQSPPSEKLQMMGTRNIVGKTGERLAHHHWIKRAR